MQYAQKMLNFGVKILNLKTAIKSQFLRSSSTKDAPRSNHITWLLTVVFRLKEYSFYLATILVAIIFSNWGLQQLMPGNLDCCSVYGKLQHDFYFYPFISIFIRGIIENIFGVVGLILIGQVIFPALIFYLIVIIFNRYLSKIWSLTIGFVSIFSFTNYPFRDFLFNLINPSSPIALGSNILPEIANFPIPSLSVLFFLLSFYYSTKLVKLDKKRVGILTILWSIQIYINAIDALFGICFWFSYFSIRLFQKEKHNKLPYLIKSTLPQLLIFVVICTPALLLADFSVGETSLARNFNVFVHYALYMLLPLLLMVILFKIHKIDSYEILYKFWPVYILMFIEALLVFIAFFFAKGVNLEILTSRISLFFLHFYYYLPVIFYASKQYYSFRIGKDGSSVINKIRKVIFIIFNRLNYIYLPFIILLVILFAISSSNNFINLQ